MLQRVTISLAAAALCWAVWAGRGETAPAANSAPAATASAPASQPLIEVTAVAIEELRRGTLAASQPKGFAPELKLTLHITGDHAIKANRVGRIKLIEAVDDTGADLTKPDLASTRRQRETMFTVDDLRRRGVGDGFSIELHVNPPARQAQRLSRVSGELVLFTGGKTAEVLVKDLTAQAGRQLQDPALAEAGLKIKLDAPALHGKAVGFYIEGDPGMIQSAELVDAAGKDARASLQAARKENGYACTVTPRGELPENATLKLTVVTGAKVLTVPVVLKDVPLP